FHWTNKSFRVFYDRKKEASGGKRGNTVMATSDKILNLERLKELLKVWKQEGKVVFTNGCFDILHLGHVDYLEKASGMGRRLVVGLNTDSSVKRLKGSERPVNNEYARARVLAALQFVDAVVLFGEDTPARLI